MWHVPKPVIYRSLGRLLAAGLIVPTAMEPGLGPQRTIYAVTPQGRQDVASWLDAPVHHIRDIRPHLLLKLALLDRAGADPADLVSRQRALPPRSASWTASLRSPLALGRGCYRRTVRRTGRRDRYRLPELLVPVPRVGRPALDVQRLRSAAHVALPVDLAATRGVRLEKAAQEPDDFPVAQRERSTFGHCHAPSSKTNPYCTISPRSARAAGITG